MTGPTPDVPPSPPPATAAPSAGQVSLSGSVTPPRLASSAQPAVGAPPRTTFNMSARALITVIIGAAVVLGLGEGFHRFLPGSSHLDIALLTLFVGVPIVFVLARQVIHRGLHATIVAVSDGLLSLTEHDYSQRLAVGRKDELGVMVHRFNRLAETLRRERNELYQKEMVPETILATTSMIVVLFNQDGRVVYSNGAARQFFAAGEVIEGRDFETLMRSCPPEVQAAAANPNDVLFTCQHQVTGGGAGAVEEPETFHLSRRYFEFSMQTHTLLVLRPLTREIARKEVETWKKAIRVLSHELNNSLAPISSLVHSARLMLDNPAHAQRLRGALDTIEDRARHLKTFLDGYASFARLPMPSKRLVPWPQLLAGVEGLYPFRVEGLLPTRPAFVDPAQFQQVLINLFKNAAESGSVPDAIAIEFRPLPGDGVEFQVVDQGKGMSEDVIKNALVPFYSTKKTGTGLGLALSREIVDAHGGRLSLHPRPGGGLAVRCWLPAGPLHAPLG
jgi:two-component system nitrogen regulation sensor histidine kinase NtrY